MAVRRQPETLRDLRGRDALASRMCALLRRDQRVVAVEAYGSLAVGRADRYSDIDLVECAGRAVAAPRLHRPAGNDDAVRRYTKMRDALRLLNSDVSAADWTTEVRRTQTRRGHRCPESRQDWLLDL